MTETASLPRETGSTLPEDFSTLPKDFACSGCGATGTLVETDTGVYVGNCATCFPTSARTPERAALIPSREVGTVVNGASDGE